MAGDAPMIKFSGLFQEIIHIGENPRNPADFQDVYVNQ
jgi:hypothetical protein